MNAKKILCTLFTVLLIQTVFPQGSEIAKSVDKRDNYFYIGPIDLFFSTLQLGYERRLKNNNTFALLGGFKLSQKNGIVERIGGNGELQYRINLLYNKEALNKLMKNYSTFAYFAPFFMYRYEEVNETIYYGPVSPDQINKTMVNSGIGGLGFGFRLTAVENRFSLNAFVGGGLKLSDTNGTGNFTAFNEIAYTGIAPRLEFHMGIAF